MNRNAAFALGALAGAAAAAFLRRRPSRTVTARQGPDERADELRRKLAEARKGRADEDDFEVAGQGAETVVEPEGPKRPFSRPPADEFEAMRRRIHEEGRAAAEEMRREDAS